MMRESTRMELARYRSSEEFISLVRLDVTAKHSKQGGSIEVMSCLGPISPYPIGTQFIQKFVLNKNIQFLYEKFIICLGLYV